MGLKRHGCGHEIQRIGNGALPCAECSGLSKIVAHLVDGRVIKLHRLRFNNISQWCDVLDNDGNRVAP